MANRSQRAYRELLRQISSGEMEPGTTVTEQELANRLGVSRTPIREALARLGQHGLISRLPGSSVVIQAIGASRRAQLAEVRGVLEGYAARLLTCNATETDLAMLEHLGQVADEAIAAGFLEQVVEAEVQFHDFLVKRSGNAELAALLESNSLLQVFFSTYVPRLPMPEDLTSVRWHRSLVAVFRKRDAHEAERAMRSHTGVYSSTEAMS